MEKLVLEIIASILAIISVYLYGNKSMKAPVFGMLAQIYCCLLYTSDAADE